ncbi:MAG: hypothetical protein RBR69_08245 [Candidatus Cloacimonadaceae bacterium]|nr:hypothetical protein [Candidatus Cloacimonadaceae bacterium]
MPSLWDSSYCVTDGCYLKCRPYRTQHIVLQLVCYLKCRPYGTQIITWLSVCYPSAHDQIANIDQSIVRLS